MPKQYFTFLTEGYTFNMAKIINFCLMLVPNKIAGDVETPKNVCFSEY